MTHLSETGFHAGRRLCLAPRDGQSDSVHAMHAPLHNPEFRKQVCPECLKVWANEAYDDADEMPDYIREIRNQSKVSKGS